MSKSMKALPRLIEPLKAICEGRSARSFVCQLPHKQSERLGEFSTPFPGFYQYYPQRRHASPALRALVDYLRRKRQDSRAKRRRPNS